MRKYTIVVISNKWAKVKMIANAGKNRHILIIMIGIWIMATIGCSRNSKESDDIIFSDKELSDPVSIIPDSIELDFIFNPERWNLNNNILWIIDSKQTPFLTGYDLSKRKTICATGHIGQGPEEYISPGIVEGVNATPSLYSNTLNKINQYRLTGDSIKIIKHGKLPLKLNDGQLPNPYTRIAHVTDSIYAGTYFLPRKIGIDLIDWINGNLISEIDLAIDQSKDSMSGPLEMKLASVDRFIVIAYRYIDLIEILYLENDGSLSRKKCIGNNTLQNELYEQDRDNEMIKYYSDIVCADGKAFLLYQGVQEGKILEAKTFLEIYSLNDGKNLKNINLKNYYNQLQVNKNGSDIYLHSPNNEEYIFHIKI